GWHMSHRARERHPRFTSSRFHLLVKSIKLRVAVAVARLGRPTENNFFFFIKVGESCPVICGPEKNSHFEKPFHYPSKESSIRVRVPMTLRPMASNSS